MDCKSVPIFNKHRVFYIRKEKKGQYSYKLSGSIGEDRTRLMNEMAYSILKQCTGCNSLDSICDYFCKLYPEVDRRRICQDVEMSVAHLVREGVLLLKIQSTWCPNTNYVSALDNGYIVALCDENSGAVVKKFLRKRICQYSFACGGADPLSVNSGVIVHREYLFAIQEKSSGNVVGLLGFVTNEIPDSSLYQLNVGLGRLACDVDLENKSCMIQAFLCCHEMLIEMLKSRGAINVVRAWIGVKDEIPEFVHDCLRTAGYRHECTFPKVMSSFRKDNWSL